MTLITIDGQYERGDVIVSKESGRYYYVKDSNPLIYYQATDVIPLSNIGIIRFFQELYYNFRY